MHQLDTMRVQDLSLTRIRRASYFRSLPICIQKILGIIGFFPPSSTRHISGIISSAIKHRSTLSIIGLVRNGCTVDFICLPESVQALIVSEIQSKGYMTSALDALIKNIPNG